jgi:hypothetical protein
MKTLIKITALAAVAAFVVLSCQLEPKLSNVKWEDTTSKFDPSRNTSPEQPYGWELSIAPESDFDGFFTGADMNHELTITFPENSDFLKAASKAQVESRMREFLSFHHFTKATAPIAGKADTLGSPLAYTFVRQNLNVITVRLTKTFVPSDSSVIMKIDATKYTYGGGFKVDQVNRGKGGEAFYDDGYIEFYVHDSDPDPDEPVTSLSGFVPPGNRGWAVGLFPITTDKNADDVWIKTPKDYVVAAMDLSGIYGETAQEVTAIYTAVGNQLASGFKIQKFTNGAWNDVSGPTFRFDPPSLDDDYPVGTFVVNNLTLEELVSFRVVWSGTAPVLSSAKYFEVNQYIKIIGVNTPYDPEEGVYWHPSYYQAGTVFGPADEVSFFDGWDGIPIQYGVFSKDFRNQNVVIDVLFNRSRGIVNGSLTSWLKDFNNDKQKFRDNFKLAYYSDDPYGNYSTANDFASRTDVVYIPIRDFEMRSFNPNNTAGVGLNSVRITLDPAYKLDGKTVYFYISPEIGYTDNKTAFGDQNNFLFNFFKAYRPNVVDPALFPVPSIPLPLNQWVEGSLPNPDRTLTYTFAVTQGADYYIWINDGYDGRLPKDKTGNVLINVRYAGDSSYLHYARDANWETPLSFTADETGTVEVTVGVYSTNDGFVGTFGILYNTNDTRLGGTGWTAPSSAATLTVDEWANGNNTASPGGEQWFKFVATATSHTIHIAGGGGGSGSLTIYAQLYNSDGEKEGTYFYKDMYNTTANSGTRYVDLDSTYYIRVYLPPYSSARGPYQIAFTAPGTTTPSVKPPASATNLPLGQWVNGTISTTTTEQWYKFTAVESDTGNHIVIDDYVGIDYMRVQTYDSDGKQVSSSSYETGKEYFVRVTPFYNGDRGTYKIMHSKISSEAPVTLPTTGVTTLNADAWADSSMTMASREQWYKFDATSNPQYIHIALRTLDIAFVEVYDNDGYGVNTASFSSGGSEPIQQTVTTNQTYYIKVSNTGGFDNINNLGTYRIKFNTTALPSWPLEPEITPTPLTLKTWSSNRLSEEENQLWFKFTASAATHYIHADFTGANSVNSMHVRIYNNNGGELENEIMGGSITLAVASSQVYYIRVTPQSNYWGEYDYGNFRIMYSSSSAPPVTLPTTGYTQLADGIWSAQATLPGTGVQWYRFTATMATQYIHAYFNSLNSLNMQLYDKDGEGVLNNVTMRSSDAVPYVARTGLTTNEVYYIQVTGVGNSGTYKMAFTSTNTPLNGTYYNTYTVTPLSLSTWADGNFVTTYTDNQWYSFNATNTTHYIHGRHVTLNDFNVQLYDSHGTPVGAEVNIYGSTLSAERSVVVGLRYYIEVSPYFGSYAGTYKIAYNTSVTAPYLWTDPTSSTTLTEREWSSKYLYLDGADWYRFDVSNGQTYKVWMDDYDVLGSGVNAKMVAYYRDGDGDSIFDADGSPQTFTTNRAGTVFVKVYSDTNPTYGNYSIAYSRGDSSTKPWTEADRSVLNATSLESGFWEVDSITTGGETWYSFTAPSFGSGEYNIWLDDSTSGLGGAGYTGTVAVGVYSSTGVELVVSSGNRWNTPAMASVSAGSTVYLKVTCINPGNFGIVVGNRDSEDRPIIIPPDPGP